MEGMVEEEVQESKHLVVEEELQENQQADPLEGKRKEELVVELKRLLVGMLDAVQLN